MNKEKAIERAKKLMAMAADSSSPNEAAIAARRARAIIDKYQINLSELGDKDQFGTSIGSKARQRTPAWEQTLCISIADLNDCIAKFDGQGRIVFKGFAEDAEVCAFMYHYITENGKRCCKAYIARNPRGCRNSFKLGYAWAVKEKISEIIKERQAEIKTSTGTSLVLLKKNLVESEFGVANYGEKATATANPSSQLAGEIAGRRTNIVTGLGGDQRAAIA